MALWIWDRLTSCASGANAAATRRRFSATASGASREPGPQFRECVDAGGDAAVTAKEAMRDAG